MAMKPILLKKSLFIKWNKDSTETVSKLQKKIFHSDFLHANFLLRDFFKGNALHAKVLHRKYCKQQIFYRKISYKVNSPQ